MSEKKVDFTTKGENQEVVNYLSSLIQGFEKKRLILTHAEDEVVLYPDDEITFKVKARLKKGEARVELKLSWKQEAESGKEILISN